MIISIINHTHGKISDEQVQAAIRAINPGGCIGFFNPATGKNETFSNRGDAAAARRIKLKQAAGKTRRTVRHQTFAQALLAKRPA